MPRPLAPPRDPPLPCPDCGDRFAQEEPYVDHRFDDHRVLAELAVQEWDGTAPPRPAPTVMLRRTPRAPRPETPPDPPPPTQEATPTAKNEEDPMTEKTKAAEPGTVPCQHAGCTARVKPGGMHVHLARAHGKGWSTGGNTRARTSAPKPVSRAATSVATAKRGAAVTPLRPADDPPRATPADLSALIADLKAKAAAGRHAQQQLDEVRQALARAE